MKTQHTDVVAEYLREVDLRLAGLPVLQRRELLADLAAHIENERVERNLQGEAELIEVLERLGSPEVVARAAYEEAGPLPPVVEPPLPPRMAPPMPPAPRRERAPWVLPVIGVGFVSFLVLMVLCAGFFAFSRQGNPAPAPEIATPAAPAPEMSLPAAPTLLDGPTPLDAPVPTATG
ncbi:HAAS signaling domain-containing protein [Actinoplanes sp. NPDC051513]|uniref:HAAS signaling domain-containing protein n=1 Tax=Actinoplanes sp. NPDC051513 TaxID=3363908 RepID=UPI0037910899